MGETNKKRYASLRAAKPKDDENDEEEIPDLDNLFDDNDKTQVNDEEPIYDDNFELIKKVTSPTKRVLIEELPDKQPDSTEPVEYRCDLCSFRPTRKMVWPFIKVRFIKTSHNRHCKINLNFIISFFYYYIYDFNVTLLSFYLLLHLIKKKKNFLNFILIYSIVPYISL